MNKIIIVFLLQVISFSSLAQLIRGPYLQAATPTSIVIRWRTETKTDSKIQLGTSLNAKTIVKQVNEAVNEHEIKITGLLPQTRYYYSIGSTVETLQGQADNYFETTAQKGQVGKYRFGVFGDCGTHSIIQDKVRNQFAAYLGNNYLNAWLLLGDNAYSYGTDAEYQVRFFNHYKDDFLKKYPLYPAPGNHDYSNDNSDRQNDHKVPYYDNFTMPKDGEAGGVASNSQSFYSFDYGNVHFLSLDSYGREDQSTRLYDTLGRQVQWIKQDLAANTNKDWVVAYWHHPPFSLGTRNGELDFDMTSIRENFIRILERMGVDLIICGHSHVYERSKLMKGFYQKAAAFNPNKFQLSQSTGKYNGSDESCPYFKTTDANQGTVYVVCGSSGQLGNVSAGFPHPAMHYSNAVKGGAMMLEVEGKRLDAKWITEDGEVLDQFTMMKDVTRNQNIDLLKGESVNLEAAFIGEYKWSTGETTKSISVSPSVSTVYQVRDAQNCILNEFSVKVIMPIPIKLNTFTATINKINSVNLEWSTEFENNFSHFEIEKSPDASNFISLGKIPSTGNSNTITKYNFNDQVIIGNNYTNEVYYRLKMVPVDDKVQYSQVIKLTINEIILALEPTSDQVTIELLPNPATKGQMLIRLRGTKGTDAKLTIYDISGNMIYHQAMWLTEQPESFLPKTIAEGTYILKVQLNETTLTKKFVLLE